MPRTPYEHHPKPVQDRIAALNHEDAAARQERVNWSSETGVLARKAWQAGIRKPDCTFAEFYGLPPLPERQ